MDSKALATVATLSIGAVIASAQGSGSSSDVAWPDTVPGRCAAAFFEMVRDGSDVAVKRFEATWASPKRTARATTVERTKGIGRIREDLGAFRANEITLSEADELMVVIERSRGPALTFEFVFDREAPGKLDAVKISEGATRPDPMTPARRASVVEAAVRALDENYVFPEVAKQMGALMKRRLAAGEYDQLRSESAFARALLDDMRSISKDLHLRLWVEPQVAAATSRPRRREDRAAGNFGFRKVEILDGNVGYVRFDGFQEGAEAERTAAAALGFLAHADAIIFDLRFNGGGSPVMIRYISSWLFDSPTHLNDMVDREGKIVEEFWTLEEIPGRRFKKEAPVYVLTSGQTFSGAEEFAYNLKALKRATIVGARTGGGAHPTSMDRLDDRFMISIPYMRAMNPITKTNWEQKGVEPDVAVSADAALERAVSEARTALGAPRAPESRPFKLMVGDPAPALRVNRYLKGSPIAEYQRGRVYVVEFWATWCGPCKEGIPHLTALQKQYGDQVTVVGLSVWEPRDRDVDPFVKDWDQRMQYTVAVDEVVGVEGVDEEQRSRQAVQKGLMSKAWLVDSGWHEEGIPRAFIVDKNGVLAWAGEPTDLDAPLAEIVAGTFDLRAATARYKTAMQLEVFARGQRAKAREARKAGDFKLALDHVEAILAKGELAADLVLKFKLLVELKRHSDAAAHYEAARSKLEWHEKTDMMSMLAWSGRDLTPDIARAAIAACDAALAQLGRDHTWPLMTQARLWHRLGKKDEALAAADRALKIAKDSDKAEMTEERRKFEAGGGRLVEP